MISTLLRGRTAEAVPSNLRSTFFHLYGDVAWMGITAGSSQSFLSVYAARLGADAWQLGLLGAGPALVGLVFTLPAGYWLRNRPMGRAVFWSAAASRVFFLFWVILPLLFPPDIQIWSYIALVLLMTIPGTVLAVSFNALYAAAVPPEWRAYVAGARNAGLSFVLIVVSILCGFILNRTSLEIGYTLVFGLGFIGAVMSTYHLWHLRNLTTATIQEPEKIRSSIGDFAQPGDVRMTGLNLRTNVGLRAFTRGVNLLRVEVLRGSYGKIMAAFFVFYFALYLPTPLFPLFWVDRLGLTDGQIGLGTATFHAAVLLGSLQLSRVAARLNNHTLSWMGALLLGSYPLLTAIAPSFTMILIASVLGGLAWSLAGGALGNYLLEQVPETDRPAYLAWYNLALNAAILTGTLAGSLLAQHSGITAGLLIAFVLRVAAGLALWRWR